MRYRIILEGKNRPDERYFTSSIKRTVEAADLECAMKQAKQDLQKARGLFDNLEWNLDSLEEIEAAKA